MPTQDPSKTVKFADRRDVRKLITMGTPHKGSPLANMVAEVFKGGLIAGAESEGIKGIVEPYMADLLSALDIKGFGTPRFLL